MVDGGFGGGGTEEELIVIAVAGMMEGTVAVLCEAKDGLEVVAGVVSFVVAVVIAVGMEVLETASAAVCLELVLVVGGELEVAVVMAVVVTVRVELRTPEVWAAG